MCSIWDSRTRAYKLRKTCSLTVAAFVCGLICFTISAQAQITVVASEYVDPRYAQIQRTHVNLPDGRLTTRSQQQLIRALQAEQGFAMRPLPLGHAGLRLIANGDLEPSGQAYIHLVEKKGVSSKPGERVAVTNVTVERKSLVLDLNGGPDHKHNFLRHIQIGGSSNRTVPIVPQNEQEAAGSRVTLVFPDQIPEITGDQVKKLLTPLIDFQGKTPVQAYTDTLPSPLKQAILEHKVLVGMTTDMVMYARGTPDNKSREMDGQTPFEEWIYGVPPQNVEFVRFNGNRVIRVETARLGETPVIYTEDQVSQLIKPVEHQLQLGDTQVFRSEERTSAPPPTLRLPGEKLPPDVSTTAAKPVQFPDALKKKPAIGNQPQSGAPTTATKPASPPSEIPNS